MNPVAKRVGQVVLGFSLLFAAALAFQNCSGYSALDSGLSNLSSSCAGTGCDQNTSAISLLVTNTVITVNNVDLPSANRVIDMGGFCNSGGFSTSHIQYMWALNGNPVSTNWNDDNDKCSDMGRFSIRAAIPGNFGIGTYALYIRMLVNVPNGTTSLQYYSPTASVAIVIK